MKKRISTLVAFVLAAIFVFGVLPATTTYAQPRVGDHMGDVLHTDIRVFLNGIPIMGYNIDGHTYIITSDLRAFGFTVDWNPATRTSSITRGPSTMEPRPVPANFGLVGSVAFPFVYTDIVTYVDGRRVQSFNIQGSTVVRLSDITAAFGVSHWDGVRRETLVATDGGQPRRPPIVLPFWSTAPPFQRNSGGNRIEPRNATMMGQPHSGALTLGLMQFAATPNQWTKHILNGQFDTFTGLLGRIDGTGATTTVVSFIGDGINLASFNIYNNMMPREISVDVRGVNVFRIEMQGGLGSSARPALANAMLIQTQ